MPRRTPVKELISDENVVDSPIRRSSRIAATTSTPTLANQGAKVTTRRNSASSDSSQTSKPTRRMSFSQESKEAETPKRTGRSSSKSPTTLLKEQNLKCTPTVARTRRASKSGTDDESNQSTASTSSDVPRRMTRRNSITEKISSLEKIEETDSPKPQKRLTRRRSSSSEPTQLEKVNENAEEKPTNMETIQENTEEDQEVQKQGQKASEVIDEMKTKSPVVVMERLKRKSIEKKVEIEEKKRKPNDGGDEKGIKSEEEKEQDEQKMPLECEVIVEENTMKFSDDNEAATTETKSEETDFTEQKTLQKSPKPLITNKEVEEADIEISNLNLQITLSSEEMEKRNLNDSGSSDKENSSANNAEKTRGEIIEKSTVLETDSVDVNVLTPCEDICSKPTTTDVDKVEIVTSVFDKKRKSIERETIKMTNSKRSVSPAFESNHDEEVAENIKEASNNDENLNDSRKSPKISSKSSDNVENNVVSKEDNNQEEKPDSSLMEVALTSEIHKLSNVTDTTLSKCDITSTSLQEEEEQETNKADVEKPLTKSNEEMTKAKKESMEENRSVENEESSLAKSADNANETTEVDEAKLAETSASKNDKNAEQLLDEKEINPETEKTTMQIELEIKTPGKDILKERKDFNDLINDDSEQETPQNNKLMITDSNCEDDNIIELEEKENEAIEESVLEPDKSISKETEKNSKENKQTEEEGERINEKHSLKKSTEEEHVISIENTEYLKETVNVGETQDKSDYNCDDKITEEVTKKSDEIEDERNTDDVTKQPQDLLTRNKSEDVFESEEITDEIQNDKTSGEQLKPELSNTEQEENVSPTIKSKTPKEQSQDEDLLNSVIDDNEMADINEFLCQVNSEDSSEKPSSGENTKSKHHSNEKAKKIQENEELNKSKEKQKSLKTSDDQSENSFREKVNDILKNKALCSDDEEVETTANDFIDDMAEEVEDEETDDEVFEDSNEISCEGESINSSDTESEHEEDTYENDSFIDDEEENNALLSGNEDFLVDGAAKKKVKKGEKPKQSKIKNDGKKYSRIVSCDASSSDNDDTCFETKNTSKKSNNEETISISTSKSNEGIAESRPIEVISIEEENEQTPTICVDSDSEDRIIKVDINDSNTSLSGSKRNSIRKSSVNIQENISLQDIEDGDLSERITKVVEWFCSGIKTNSEMSGNISLNVSLDYKDEQTEENSSESTEKTQKKTRKRRSTEPEGAASLVKVRKTIDAKEPSSGKKKRTSSEPSVSNVNVEIVDENDAITPSKTIVSNKKNEAEINTDSEDESENNDTTLPSSIKKKGLKKALESDEPSLIDVNVEVIEESDIIVPSKTTTSPNKADRSKKSKQREEENEDNEVFSPVKSKETIALPSSSSKKKSKRVLESTGNDSDVSIEMFSPTKTKEPSTKKSKLIDVQDKQIEVSSPIKIKESSTSARNKSKKTAIDDFEDGDVQVFWPTSTIFSNEPLSSQMIDVDVSELTVPNQNKKMKKSQTAIINETISPDEPEVTHVIKEKILKSVAETSKEKSLKKKKKKLEDVSLQIIEDDMDINEEKPPKTMDVKKKIKKDSNKMDEEFLVIDKKKTKVKGSNKTTDEVSSSTNDKKHTKDSTEEEFKLNKGKKRAITISISQKSDSNNQSDFEKPILRKQRKIQDIEVTPAFQFTELKIQHLDDWTKSPAHVTPTLSEIPEENQRKANKKKGKGNAHGKNVLIPSLNMDDSAWETETITQEYIGVSKQMKVIKKKRNAGSSKLPSFHPRDFKNQMLHCMGRVDRMDSKILLRNRKIV